MVYALASKRGSGFTFWLLWSISLVTITAMLCALGTWQLRRADEKRVLLQQLVGQAVKVAQLNQIASVELLSTLTVTGQFQTRYQWLLDNQMFEHQFGYGVLTPFCDDRACVLVDRGWVQASLSRKDLPDWDTPTGMLSITGTLTDVSKNPLLTQNEKADGWPRRIQIIQFGEMQQQLPGLIDARILHLNKAESGAFQPLWKPVNMGPDKHMAYAVQWFSMAVVFVLLMGWVARQRMCRKSQ